MPHTPLICADCGEAMVLRSGQFGPFYGCTGFPRCKGAIGARDDGQPIGTPATQETRTARREAHRVFDRLWNGERDHRRTRRTLAYAWLADKLQLDPNDCHIGLFDLDTCNQVIALSAKMDRKKLLAWARRRGLWPPLRGRSRKQRRAYS